MGWQRREAAAALLLWLIHVIHGSSPLQEVPMEGEALVQPATWWTDPESFLSGESLSATELNVEAARDEAQPLPTLTDFGRRIRRVLVASLVAGACRSDDWRGDLPRYLSRFLPGASVVLLRGRHEWRCSNECLEPEMLSAIGERSGRPHSAGCADFMGSGSAAIPADLVLLLGTGKYIPCGPAVPGATKRAEDAESCLHPGTVTPEMVPDVARILRSAYVGPNTAVIHVPIRKEPELRALGALFPAIRHVMDDSEFLKPLSEVSIAAMEEACAVPGLVRAKMLLYVARYIEHKGQLAFLEAVDPRELKGYEVHFYGSDYTNMAYRARLQETAGRRNISAVIHPSVSKLELLRLYCAASGIVHYAADDNNPRAPYEALYAGNPLLITNEASLHKDLYMQIDFVVSLAFGDKEAFPKAFQRFMRHVQHADELQPEIRSFVHARLFPFHTYKELCEQMGICKASNGLIKMISSQL